MTKAFDCCMAIDDDPCKLARRVCVVVGADGIVREVIDPFDAREGPKALLASLASAEL